MPLVVLCSLLLVLVLPSAVHAVAAAGSVLYVDKGNSNCSDSGPGTAAQPFCTIGAAAARATGGTTVQVAAGTYNEQVSPKSGAQDNPVIFLGAAGSTVTGTGAQSSRGFYLSSRSWVTIQGFTVTNTGSDGIYVSKSSHISVIGNHVSFSGQPASGKTAKGITLNTTTDSLVKDNVVDHNTTYGIYVVTNSTRNQIVGNQISFNASVYTRQASGIRLHSSPGNTISSNVSHDNEDSGIELLTGSNDNLVVNNVSYRNGDHGIDNLDITGQRVVSNSVYNNVTAGINVEGGSSGVTLANNISVDNGINSPRTMGNIRVEAGSTTGTTINFDLVSLRTSGTMVEWGGQLYSTLAALVAATGQEARGIQADPRWASAANGNFHLTSGSPAIDSANSGASGQMDTDVEGHARVDDPGVTNTGIGPRSYDDRGAYEFDAVPLDHIVISPATATIAAGGSQSYTAQGFDASGNSLGDVTSSTTFSVSPDGSCVGSVCTATIAGAHTVTGNDGGKTNTASLTVTAGPLHHLGLSPASATIASGGSQAYTAQGRDQYDNSLGDVTASTTFSIAPNGSCTGASCGATAAGAHTVTGTNSGKTGTASLQVNAAGLDHIVISPSSSTRAAGVSQTYTAEGFDASGNSVGDVTAFTTFSISPNGSCVGSVCTATIAGGHIVTGNDGGKTSTASLTVTAGPLDHLVLSPGSATIASGGSQAYTAQGRDQYNNSLGDLTASTTFSIAPDGSCTAATCTATAAGAHTVTGTNAGKTGTASLTVTAGALDHLVLSPASATVSAGGSQAYTAEGRDQYDNSLGNVTSSTTFSIAPDGSCTGPTCTASLSGTHTVTGTKAGKTGTASLEVTANSLDHIVISPASATIGAGSSQAYTAEGFDASNNSLGDVTAFTAFSISPDGSCTGATCTATAAGAHNVTGNDAGKTSTASLTVTAGPLDHLALSPATATIPSGGSQDYTADGRDQFDNPLGDVTASTTFSIAPNGSCTGATCTASLAGAHTVTGTNAGKTGTASLDVTAGTAVDHIVISPASATIGAGGSQAYTAEGFDASNNSLGDVTASTSFSIAPNGSCSGAVCTATAAGAHTVTGNDGGKTSTASLSVTAGALDHLALSPATATIPSGGSQAYTADGRDQFDNPLGDVTASTTFSIAPNGSCTGATCSASQSGAHTVTGTSAGKTGTASLQVGAGALDHIVISPSSATINAGRSQAYTAQGFDASGNSIGDVTSFTTFTIAPEGSCTGNVCTANAGGSHTVTGNDGGKTNTASLKVDFVKNPGFETDTSGWNTGGSSSGVTLARVAGGHSGSWAAKITNTSSVAGSCVLNDSPNWVLTTSAATYASSVWARADAAGALLKLRIREYNGSTLVGTGTTQMTLTTDWQQLSLTYSAVAPGSSTLDYNVYISSAAPGTCFYADDAAVYIP
jgi:parallel beta-helix repeat protein